MSKPKDTVIWMAYHRVYGFYPWVWGYTRRECLNEIGGCADGRRPVRVEIREVKKRKAKVKA